jgi:hypothetical protein
MRIAEADYPLGASDKIPLDGKIPAGHFLLNERVGEDAN